MIRVLCALYSIHGSAFLVCNAQCSMCNLLCSVKCTVGSVKCTVFSDIVRIGGQKPVRAVKQVSLHCAREVQDTTLHCTAYEIIEEMIVMFMHVKESLSEDIFKK